MGKIYNLTGVIPAKKNSKRIFIHNRTGKLATLSSKRHEAWHSHAYGEILQQGIARFTEPVKITVCFTFGDKRMRDCSNLFESIADLLVDCGVIADDNYVCVPKIVMYYAGYKKGEFVTEVKIQDMFEFDN